ncbi:MAG TPA: hypothetical protein VNS52_03570 [Gemmatimonadaceae bacterium]|nr:hypothetical protein [Gemmatimonadaceae bacterium]
MAPSSRGAPPAPFFTSGGDAASADVGTGRRLILISHHFPPGQSVGALRWQMMARYAAERGWGLDVVTLDPASHREGVDLSRLDELPPGVRVYTVPLVRSRVEGMVNRTWRIVRRLRDVASRGRRRQPASLAAPADEAPRRAAPAYMSRGELMGKRFEPRDLLRTYFAWVEVDLTRRWAHAAADVATRIARRGVHRAVVTSGPPHMTHEGGRLVATRTGLAFVMDLRDPWSLSERLPEFVASKYWYRTAARYERRALRRASLVVSNTEAAARALRARHPDAAERIITVMNGCDEEPMPRRTADGRLPFVIAYAGTIYLDRDPRLLFRAAARVVRDLALTPADLQFRFMGQNEGYDVVAVAREEGLGDGFVLQSEPRPRRDALRFLADAALLVSLPQDSEMAIPAKVFDYAQFDAWVLALVERESATGVLLDGSGADVVAPKDVDTMEGVLRTHLAQYRRGERPRALNAEGRFSRRTQADVLLNALDRITR